MIMSLVLLVGIAARLIQPVGSFPVDFENFDPETRKLFHGWITDRGIVKYTIGLYEDYWTGEIVVLDDSGREMFRISRDRQYDKYDLQRELFNLGTNGFLEDRFSRGFGQIKTVCCAVSIRSENGTIYGRNVKNNNY